LTAGCAVLLLSKLSVPDNHQNKNKGGF